MRKFDFRLLTEDDLILVEAFVNGFPLILALDTAASQTIIDWNALFLAGCSVPYETNSESLVTVETAAGMMDIATYQYAFG